jgi:5-methylcytosine-specific restriction enzyme subunit McrC
MTIPLQNVFYLFCYAWDQYREGLKTDVGGLESPRLQDLLAKVLIASINRILRRGLDRNYIIDCE